MEIPNFYTMFLVGGGFVGGFLCTYIFTLIKFIFFDHLPWPYTLMLSVFVMVSMTESMKNGRLRWMYDNRSKIDQMSRMVTALIPKPDLSSSSFSIADSNQAASLIYSRMGTEYLLNVPYDTSALRVTNRIRVILSVKPKEEGGNREIDVTQQPCIPYLCTAEQLGGTGYKVVDKMSDEIIFECGKDVILNFDAIAKNM
jgi:hypothetical protein